MLQRFQLFMIDIASAHIWEILDKLIKIWKIQVGVDGGCDEEEKEFSTRDFLTAEKCLKNDNLGLWECVCASLETLQWICQIR